MDFYRCCIVVFICLQTVTLVSSVNIDIQPSPVATVTEGSVLWLTCAYDLAGRTLGQLQYNKKDGGIVATVTPLAVTPCEVPVSGYNIDCDNLASSEVRLGILNPVHGDNYRCIAYLQDKTSIGPVSTEVSVVVPVTNVTFTSPVSDTETVTPGGSQLYTCVTGSCRPPARIDWYKDGVNVTNQTGSVNSVGDKFVTTSSLTLIGSKGDTTATVQCRASNVDGMSPLVSGDKTFVVEWVPDGPPVISGYTSFMNLYVNDKLSLRCRQPGGNPLATLTWSGNCGTITATNSNTATEAVSDFIITVSKDYNQATCTCVSTHPQPQSQDKAQVTFTVHYPPDKDPAITGYTDDQVIYEGTDDLSLTCTQEGGNPLAAITWDCVGQTGTPVGGNTTQTTSTVQVPRDRDINRKSCSCTARSPDINITFVRTASVIFTIYWAPDGPPVISGYTSLMNLYVNDLLSLRCRQPGGNPLATLTWSGVCEGNPATNSNTATEAVSNITITVSKDYNEAMCTCVSTHSQPQSQDRTQITFTVHYPPDKDPAITGYTDDQIIYEGTDDLSLTCTQEGGNPLAAITWDCVGQTGTHVGGNTTQTTSNVQVPRDRNINRKSCSCTARSPDTNITFVRTASVKFTIYYAPLAPQLPRITGYTSGEVLYEGDPAKPVECHQAGGFPLATLTWNCIGLGSTDTTTDSESTSRIQLSSDRTYNGRNCTCTAAHPDSNVVYHRSVYVTITVYYPPSTPVLTQTPTHPWLEGDSGTLMCNYSEGFPAPARIQWFRDGNLQTGQSTSALTLTTLSHTADRAGYSCRVSNNFTETKFTDLVSSTTNLNVEYKPLVTLTTAQLTVVEGRTGQIICEATGNPTPTLRWLRGGSTVRPGNGTSLDLTFDNVDRSATGNYTCQAEGVSTVQGRQLVTEGITVILIQYPPDVLVVVPSDVEEGDTGVHLMCKTTGEPNKLISQSWTQSIDLSFIADQFKYATAEKDTIVLSEVFLDDTGTYACSVSNGIADRQGDTLQSNSAVLDVIVSPKFNDSGQNHRFYSKLHDPLTVKIPFYSNPPVTSADDIEWTTLTNSTFVNTTFNLQNEEAIDLSVKGRIVKFHGQAAILNLSSFDQSMAGTYNITVYNYERRRQSMTTFTLTPSGPPETPTDFRDTDVTQSSITVEWTKSFNGGHSQTFVIVYGPEAEGFIHTVSMDENMQSKYKKEITGLNPNTRYRLNMYAYNEEGNSSLSVESDIIGKTYEEKENDHGTAVAAIAGGVGGSIAGLLVIAAVVIVLYRKRIVGKRDDSCQRSDAALCDNSEDGEEDGLKMNILYESAGPYMPESQHNDNVGERKEDYTYAEVNKKNNFAGAAYAEVVPKKERKAKQEESGDIYAEVQKNGKGKKGMGKENKKKVVKGKKKKKKADNEGQTGTIYENVGAVGEKPEELYANADDVTERGKSASKERNNGRSKNKDGLIYLDLEFKEQQNGARQVVIHGIENRNDYAIVDFTKHADPLPEEDTEEKHVATENK